LEASDITPSASVPCVLSPASGEIWQGHKLHRQPQLPIGLVLNLFF
jgi:hypothetical protein